MMISVINKDLLTIFSNVQAAAHRGHFHDGGRREPEEAFKNWINTWKYANFKPIFDLD